MRHLAILACASALFIAAPVQADVFISKKPTSNMTCSAGVCTPTAATAVLNVTQLESLLASGSVAITAGGAEASDIISDASLTWASGYTLTLDAYRSLTIEEPIAVSGAGGVTILTNDGGSGGALSFQGKGSIGFLGLTNALSINGAAYKLENTIAGMASDIAASSWGNYALAASYNAKSDPVYTASPIPTTFSGTFEGLGNAISHVRVRDKSDEFVGFFAFVDAGRVNDLKILDANVVAVTGSEVGILTGNLEGAISGVVTSGTVQAANGEVGGVAGGACGENISTSQSSAAVTITTSGMAGGLVGYECAGGAIQTSFATGAVTTASGWAGGLVGSIGEGSISNSYATGNATTNNGSCCEPAGSAGGLLGYGFESSVQDSYSTGTAIGGSGAYAGGLIGIIYDGGSFGSNYWDTTTSTNTVSLGNPSGTVVATGLSTTQFQAGLPHGFGKTTWKENATINGGLPYLLANPPAK
jgi:hypothetical protein